MLIIGIIKWKFRGKSFIAAIEASFDERKAIHNTEMAAIDEAIDRLKKKNSQLTAELAALSGKLKAGIYQVRFK